MSENDNAAVTAVMNRIASYGERMNAGFGLVHHSSKGGQANKNVVDVGAGAAALSRAGDTHLVLREHEADNAVVMEARTRSWEQPDPLVLRWDFPIWTPAPDLDPASLKTTVSRVNGKPNRMDSIVAKVREMLTEPVTRNALRKDTGANGTEISTVINSMIEAGEVEACEVVTGGGKFPGFRLLHDKVGKGGKGWNSRLTRGGVVSSLKGNLPTTLNPGNAGLPTRHPEFDEWTEGIGE
jgi:hypothetical protein